MLCIGVPICRTGWQDYGEGETPLETGEDGIVRIFRSEMEVFRPETIASFEGKALTIKHPKEFVSPDNWQYLAKGQLHNIRKAKEEDEDGELALLADILVNEARAIQLVKKGLREVSCGYEAEYEQTGEGKGIQTTIVGNHLALVEQGRAGSSYAINDERGKGIMTKFEKAVIALKKKFGAKVVDAAMESCDDYDEGGETATVDKGMMDELVKTVKDLQIASKRIEGMVENKKAKDEEKKSKDGTGTGNPEQDEKKDDKESEDAEGGEMEERLTALEAAVAKLLEKQTDDEEESKESEDEDEEEESEDDMDESEDEGEEKDKSEDSDEGEEGEQSQKKLGKTGDAARTEILAPGFKPLKNSKTFKASALKRAYATKDGKKVIHTLTGGKKPDYNSPAQVGMLFNAASEILKAQRGTGLAGTKLPGKFEVGDSKTEPMSAEQLNELNAKHYGEKKGS